MANDFGLDQVLDSQNNKETTINSAIDQLAQAVSKKLAVDLTAGSHTLSTTEATRYVHYKRTDTTAARTLTTLAKARFFFVQNSAVSTSIILGSTTIVMAASEFALFYTDGTANDLTRILSSVASAVTSLDSLIALTADISPGALAGTTSDWAPTGLATASVIRVTLTGNQDLTGLTGGADGRIIMLMNVDTADTLTLKHEVTSSASNQFRLPGSADMALTPNSAAFLMYDSTVSRWRVIGGTGSGGGGAAAFTDLTDAPASYSGQAFDFVRVASGNASLEFFTIPYLVPMYGPGSYTNGQLVQRFKVVEPFRLPSGASGSQADAGTASTGNVDFHIKKNGSDVGTVTYNVSTSGTFTVGSDADFAAGDVLTFVGPATADATLADVSITLKCKRIA
jgi:hypothetical protein